MVFVCAAGAQQVRTLVPPGLNYGGRFGFTVVGVPDVDGDGCGDVAVGAPSEHWEGQVGAVHLYSGATGDRLRTLLSSTPYGTEFGEDVAGIGDLDGDGRGEVVAAGYAEQRAYVFSGASGGILYMLSSPLDGRAFGASVAAIPDTDGDGLDEIAVGSYEGRGLVHLFSGATGAHVTTLYPNPVPMQFFGLGGVAGVPDTDGDGRGDIVVGSPREDPPDYPDEEGRAYLFSGATGQLRFMLDCPEHPTYEFGRTVAGLPDVDGDGRGDVAIGSLNPPSSPGEPLGSSGRAYVFSGATGALLAIVPSPNPQFYGLFAVTSIAGMPDVNHDGVGEFLSGARHESPPGLPGVGQAYVLSGLTGLAVATLIPPRLHTYPADWFFGHAIAALPDASGDGRPDVIVSAYNQCAAPCPPIALGAVHIYYSCAADWNYDRRADSQDFFGFLRTYFTAPQHADFNRDSVTDANDFFDFLSAFLSGCPA